MRVLANAALRRYHACAPLVKQEFGGAPSPETVASFEAISAESLAGTAGLPSGPLDQIPASAVFWGCAEERRRLAEWLDDPYCRLVLDVS
jgi:hypothetical protein